MMNLSFFLLNFEFIMKNNVKVTIQMFSGLSKSSKTWCRLRDGWRYQKGWIFGKVPNGLWPPPLIFGKWFCNFVYNFMLKTPYLKIQNLQRKCLILAKVQVDWKFPGQSWWWWCKYQYWCCWWRWRWWWWCVLSLGSAGVSLTDRADQGIVCSA